MHPNIEVQLTGPKYVKSSFTNSGHAFNLAEKLNIRFNTEEFNVMLMSPERVLRELN
jgi:hypothetical protein